MVLCFSGFTLAGMTGFFRSRAAGAAITVSVVATTVLAGCGGQQETTTAPVTTPSVSVTTEPPTTTPTATQSAETRTASGSAAAPATSSAGGAVRSGPQTYAIAGGPNADFADSSGKLWCTLADSNYAACMVPSNADGMSWPTDYCADEVDVVGIRLDSKVGFDCSTDAYIQPDLPSQGGNINAVKWFYDNNVSDKLDGSQGDSQGMAVLPAGDSLQRGDISCQNIGGTVTCMNSATNAGFSITPTGFQTTGEQWDKEQGFQLAD